jgi:hypothetical protein
MQDLGTILTTMPEPQPFNYCQVDPESTPSDSSGRYSPNFVRYPAFLAPVNWRERLSRTPRRRSGFEISAALLKTFDQVGALHERWGTPGELEALRRKIALFGINIDRNAYLSPIAAFNSSSCWQ